jgi:outer membrane protein OmpU
MNNLKKLGLTALAGSLVAVSAQAGELAVSGSATIAYKQASNAQGSGIGSNKAWGLSGSGELDNGWSVAHAINLTDANALSSSTTALTMGSLGTITIGQGHGGNSGSYDEEVPQAYEQVSDLQDTAMNYSGSWLGNGSVGWALPSFDIDGAGSLSVTIGYAPDADNVAVSDGGSGGHGSTYGNGMDLGVKLVTDMGLTLGAYGAERENITHVPSGITDDAVRDEFNGSWFATYAAGPVSIGYQKSYVDTGLAGGTVTAATTAKAIGTSDGIWEDVQMSILFNVNDNLSVSWTDSTSTYDAQDNASTAIADVDQDSDAIQIAYSMGGMSINAYMMSVSNPGWDSDAKDIDATEVSIGLAF